MSNASDRAATMWLQAFGVAGLGRAGEEAALPLGMKAVAMLVYLAEAAPKPVARETLVELLWERVAPAQGKGSLRQEIRRLKKVVGEDALDGVLTVSDQHLAIRPGALRYDAAAALAAAEADDADEIAKLLDICDGEFLASNAARADSFQHWALERREFLKDLTLSALARLGFMDLDAGRFERAQAAAERMAAIDPLHEKGHEIVIRAHLASGRRGQARAHFERFRALMLRELATEPDKDIAALVAPGPDFAARPAASKPAEKSAKKTAAKPAPTPPAKTKAPDPATGGEGYRPVIAVMNASRQNGADQAYLGDGVAEQVVANLSRSAWIRVAALNLAPYPAFVEDVDRSQRDIRDFAQYVLRLDVRAAKERVAITATLNRVSDNATIFSDQMEDRIEDLLALQRKVALRIASIFEPMVIDEESKRQSGIDWSESPDSIDHWRLLMRARWLFWTTRARNNAEARRLLMRALELRPGDAPSLCILAFTHMLDAWADWTGDVDGAVAAARRWAERAVETSPNDGWSHFTLGVMCSSADKLDLAKSRIEHARGLDPALVPAVGDLARLHVFAGDNAAGRALADEALARSPYDQQAGLWVRTKAIADWVDGDMANALKLIDYALIVRPGWFQNYVLRAAILAELGRVDEAREAFEAATARVGDYSDAALRIGHPFRDPALTGRFAAALNKAGGRFET